MRPEDWTLNEAPLLPQVQPGLREAFLKRFFPDFKALGVELTEPARRIAYPAFPEVFGSFLRCSCITTHHEKDEMMI